MATNIPLVKRLASWMRDLGSTAAPCMASGKEALMRCLCFCIVTVALFLGGCGKATTVVSSPSEPGYSAAETYSAAHRGQALLILKGGNVVFEAYSNGFSSGTAHLLASGTKSFWGVATVAAIEDGLISSWDERVADTITEWQSDPRKSQITIRQLLSLTSGLDAGALIPPSYADAVDSAAIDDPGTTFNYGPVPYQVFGELLKRKLASSHENALDYLKRRILMPIGLQVSSWNTQPNGDPNLPSGAYLTVHEWAKFGQLIMQQGTWQGQSIVSAQDLAACFQGTTANLAYGETFWLNNPVPAAQFQGDDDNPFVRNAEVVDGQMGILVGGPSDLVMAAGAGNQRLYMIPSQSLIVVRFGNGGDYKDADFLRALLGSGQ